jgi:hypothetical protein
VNLRGARALSLTVALILIIPDHQKVIYCDGKQRENEFRSTQMKKFELTIGGWDQEAGM